MKCGYFALSISNSCQVGLPSLLFFKYWRLRSSISNAFPTFSKPHSVFPIRGTSSVFTSMSSTSWDMLVNFKPVSIRINILINKLNCWLLIKDWRFKGAASIHLSQIYYLPLQGEYNFLRAKLREKWKLRGTNIYVQEQISDHITAMNGGYCLCIKEMKNVVVMSGRGKLHGDYSHAWFSVIHIPIFKSKKKQKKKIKIATTKRKQIANHRKD